MHIFFLKLLHVVVVSLRFLSLATADYFEEFLLQVKCVLSLMKN
jgi:hypothetical protein